MTTLHIADLAAAKLVSHEPSHWPVESVLQSAARCIADLQQRVPELEAGRDAAEEDERAERRHRRALVKRLASLYEAMLERNAVTCRDLVDQLGEEIEEERKTLR